MSDVAAYGGHGRHAEREVVVVTELYKCRSLHEEHGFWRCLVRNGQLVVESLVAAVGGSRGTLEGDYRSLDN